MSFLSFLSVGIPSSSRLVYRPVYPQVIPAVVNVGSGKKPKPQRFLVEIDGKDYFFRTVEEAVAFINAYKARLAKETAETPLRKAVKVTDGVVTVKKAEPKIEVKGAPELQAVVDEANAALQMVYVQMLADHIAKIRQEEGDEEDFMLL